jgi:hypothetical protein
MITIAVLNSLSDAFVLRSMLQSEDIPSFIPDENTIQVDWTLTNAVGGVRVQVPEGFEEVASRVVGEYRANGLV